MIGPTRIWYNATKPTTPPTSFSKAADVLVLEDGTAWMWSGTSWMQATPAWLGRKGDQGIQGPKGDPGPAGTSSGSANFGHVRWVTNATELNSAWDGVLAGTVRSIQVAGDFTATKSLVIPANYSRILEIEMHGSAITVPAGMSLFQRSYASLSDANAGIDGQLRIRNGIFYGTPTSTAFDVQATYGSRIEGNRFYGFGTAIKCGWMMGNVIEQNYFWENNISIDLDYARFTGGSNSESQSNHAIISNNKFRHSAGQFGAIKATAVSGLQVFHNIFEGDQAGPQYEVYFDDANSNVVKEVNIFGNHVEQAPSVAGFYVKLNDGKANIGGIFSQYKHNLVKFETGAYAKCELSDIPYLPTGTTLQSVGGGARWKFRDMPSTWDPDLGSNWVGGVAPTYSRIDWHDPNGQKPSIKLAGRTV